MAYVDRLVYGWQIAHNLVNFYFSPPDLIHVHKCLVFDCSVRGLYQLTVRVSFLYRKLLGNGRGPKGGKSENVRCMEMCVLLNVLPIALDTWRATRFTRPPKFYDRSLQPRRKACEVRLQFPKHKTTYLFLCPPVEWVITMKGRGGLHRISSMAGTDPDWARTRVGRARA